MPFVGSIIPHALLAGDQRAQRIKRDQDQDRAEAPGRFKRILDEADLTTRAIEATDAPRNVKPNEDEESHEERTEQGYYNPRGESASSLPGPNLDIEG